MRLPQGVRIKESSRKETAPKRWKQPKGQERTEMKKETKLLRCTLLTDQRGVQRKYMRRYKGKCDIFFGIEHRLRKEEMEEQFNREAKEGWILPTQQESPMKEQVVRTESIRLEESLLRLTATWGQSWERKKERLVRSLETKEELPKHG